jgi:hypothetical protein
MILDFEIAMEIIVIIFPDGARYAKTISQRLHLQCHTEVLLE